MGDSILVSEPLYLEASLITLLASAIGSGLSNWFLEITGDVCPEHLTVSFGMWVPSRMWKVNLIE